MRTFFRKLFYRPPSLKNRVAELEYVLQKGKDPSALMWTDSLWGNIRSLTQNQEILSVLLSDVDYIAQSTSGGLIRDDTNALGRHSIYSVQELKEKGYTLTGITKSDLQIWVKIKGE